jgi:hypothetical protein
LEVSARFSAQNVVRGSENARCDGKRGSPIIARRVGE